MLALLFVVLGAVPLEQYDPSKPLPRSEYERRTLRELTLLRNISYAKAHNPFRRKWLNAWFSKQKWYSADETMDESLLTDTMRKNAEAIGEYEASLKPEELLERRDAVRAKEKLSPEDEI